MPSAPRFTLNDLPPALREQAERQIARASSFFSGGTSQTENSTPEVRRKRLPKQPDPEFTVKSVKVSEDGNKIQIILADPPSRLPTAQQKGAFVGKDHKVHFFTKGKIAKAAKALAKALSPYAHLVEKWGRVPVQFTFDAYYPYPSGTPKKHQHKIGPHMERPDGDNLLKLPADVLTNVGFWEDDAHIGTYVIRKRRTTGPSCIKMTIENLQPKFEALYAEEAAAENPDLFNPNAPKPSETNPLSDLLENSPTPPKQNLTNGMQ